MCPHGPSENALLFTIIIPSPLWCMPYRAPRKKSYGWFKVLSTSTISWKKCDASKSSRTRLQHIWACALLYWYTQHLFTLILEQACFWMLFSQLLSVLSTWKLFWKREIGQKIWFAFQILYNGMPIRAQVPFRILDPSQWIVLLSLSHSRLKNLRVWNQWSHPPVVVHTQHPSWC